MNLGIKDKTALVTASSRGLGKAIALQLSKEGANVAICARNEGALSQTKKEIMERAGGQVIAQAADVTDKDQAEKLVKLVVDKFGTIDILICNAGGPPSGMAEDFCLDDYRDALELNLVSTVNLCYQALPHMKKQKWGRIVNLTSVSAKQPIETLILSNTARAGVLGFSKSLSSQLAPFGITVNSVCPGYTRTERVENLAMSFEKAGKGSVQDFFQNIENIIPMGRLGRPYEIAAAVVFLCSEAASYITGVALQVDGGFVKAIF
ncbi:MAG: SDR family oxidoreductase [Candidatus Aminicenantes bacterium]|nr:MAG: SDR family oxidoreductase [Candidatus Aminicenantes bacterium]